MAAPGRPDSSRGVSPTDCSASCTTRSFWCGPGARSRRVSFPPNPGYWWRSTARRWPSRWSMRSPSHRAGRDLPGRRTHRRGVSGEHGVEAAPAGVGGRARSRHRLASVGRSVALGRGAPVRPGRDGDAGAWRGAADVPGQRGRQGHPMRGYAGPRGEPLGGRLQPRPGGATRDRNGGAAVRGQRRAQYCSSMNL